MMRLLRKIMPAWVFDIYHRILSWLAAAWYGNPSDQLIVIGVTGTNGKSSTCYFLAHALEATGEKTGMTSTAMFKVADREWTNNTKMTMLGRFQLQRLLREMVDAGCAYAVVETSSQGIVQHRHEHIAYDACVFTNLTPEHIEAHGGFERYKEAKLTLFRYVSSLPSKKINGNLVARIAILNREDQHAKDFASAWGDQKILWYGLHEGADKIAKETVLASDHVEFTVDGIHIRVNTPGGVMIENALAAISAAEAFGAPLVRIADQLAKLPAMPGRYESVDEGQDFTVIVDYAYEPAALGKLFDFAQSIKKGGKIIHITGSAGGGRDIARRPLIGALSAEQADITIVTNEDPYDDEPMEIIDQVADAAIQAGKKENESLFRILDRGEAIKKAISLAQAGDVVLITGKGNEPVIAVANGSKIPWDDRGEVRKILKDLKP